jgi:hypothetical protein
MPSAKAAHRELHQLDYLLGGQVDAVRAGGLLR